MVTTVLSLVQFELVLDDLEGARAPRLPLLRLRRGCRPLLHVGGPRRRALREQVLRFRRMWFRDTVNNELAQSTVADVAELIRLLLARNRSFSIAIGS